MIGDTFVDFSIFPNFVKSREDAINKIPTDSKMLKRHQKILLGINPKFSMHEIVSQQLQPNFTTQIKQ